MFHWLGILHLDTPALCAVNGVNPLISVATLPNFARVAEGVMVATVKMIALGVPTTDIDRAMGLGRRGLARLAPCFTTATLIETALTRTPPPQTGREALRMRLSRLGSR